MNIYILDYNLILFYLFIFAEIVLILAIINTFSWLLRPFYMPS